MVKFEDDEFSGRQIDRLLHADDVGVFLGDPAGRTYEANDAYLAMHGYASKDLLEHNVDWLKLTPPDWRVHSDVFRKILAEERTPISYQKEHLHQAGHRIPLSVNATPIRGSDLVLVTLVDLSPQSPLRHGALGAALEGAKRRFGLTNREHDVLALLLESSTTPEIAAQLCITPATVNEHVQKVMQKCGVQRRSQLFKRVVLS